MRLYTFVSLASFTQPCDHCVDRRTKQFDARISVSLRSLPMGSTDGLSERGVVEGGDTKSYAHRDSRSCDVFSFLYIVLHARGVISVA